MADFPPTFIQLRRKPSGDCLVNLAAISYIEPTDPADHARGCHVHLMGANQGFVVADSYDVITDVIRHACDDPDFTTEITAEGVFEMLTDLPPPDAFKGGHPDFPGTDT